MTSRSGLEIAAILAAYQWPAGRVVDVGGGHRALLEAILVAQPAARGILFDLPRVIEGVAPLPSDLAERCELVAAQLLRRCARRRRAAPPQAHPARLGRWTVGAHPPKPARNDDQDVSPAVLVHVLPLGNELSQGKPLDLQILVMTSGGRERSEQGYAALLEQAGLVLTLAIPIDVGIGLVEAAPA